MQCCLIQFIGSNTHPYNAIQWNAIQLNCNASEYFNRRQYNWILISLRAELQAGILAESPARSLAGCLADSMSGWALLARWQQKIAWRFFIGWRHTPLFAGLTGAQARRHARWLARWLAGSLAHVWWIEKKQRPKKWVPVTPAGVLGRSGAHVTPAGVLGGCTSRLPVS